MAGTLADDEADKPLDPAVEKVRRKLVRFVAINLGLLFVALMAVLGAIVYQSGQGGETPGDRAESAGARSSLIEGKITIPDGLRILSHAISGDRISFDTQGTSGVRAILIYDIADGRLVGRLKIDQP